MPVVKLDPHDVRLIRALWNEGIKVADIAEKFEVDKYTIYRVIKRITWAHVV
jgi:predicted transcriptional regulator